VAPDNIVKNRLYQGRLNKANPTAKRCFTFMVGQALACLCHDSGKLLFVALAGQNAG